MSFREVRVFEVRELLRWWVEGLSLRKTTERSAFDRKTVRRYVEAAQELGVVQGGDGDQLTDEVLAACWSGCGLSAATAAGKAG